MFEDSLLGQTLLGKYRLQQIRLRVLFGVVFAAEQFFCRTFVRPVLVMITRQTGITEVTAPHFFGDAIRLAQVNQHPAWPSILELATLPEHDGRGVMVTESVERTPEFAAPPSDLTSFLQSFVKMCRAVAALHRHGVIHRELRADAFVVGSTTAHILGAGLTTAADPRELIGDAAADVFAHLAPETLEGKAGPQADVYGLGLLLYEGLTGGGPHLLAPWDAIRQRGVNELIRVKQSLRFAPLWATNQEIRQTAPWLDQLAQRCLEADPALRFQDAANLLVAMEAGVAGEAMPWKVNEASSSKSWLPPARSADPFDVLIRDARRSLALGNFDQAINGLDIHRPAEWTVVDERGARILRVLGQAYVRHGDWRSGRECLEQLRSLQHEQHLLPPPHYATVLTDLLRCYTQLALNDLAGDVREEARQSAGNLTG